jgi:hypothetical protein
MQLYDQLDQRQPNAESAETPAPLPSALVIQVKNPGEQMGSDPNSIITEFENHRIPRTPYAQMNLATGLGVAGCIGKEVVDDLLEPQRIRMEIHRVSGERD